MDNSLGFSGPHFHEMDKSNFEKIWAFRDRLQNLYPIVQSNLEKVHVPAHVTHEILHHNWRIKQINHKPTFKMRKIFDIQNYYKRVFHFRKLGEKSQLSSKYTIHNPSIKRGRGEKKHITETPNSRVRILYINYKHSNIIATKICKSEMKNQNITATL